MNLKQLQVDAATAKMPFQDYLLYLIANGGGSSSSVTLADLLAALQTVGTGYETLRSSLDINVLEIYTGYNQINFLGGTFYNPNTYPVTVKFYNLPSADVVVGTSTPCYSIMIPALGQVVLDATTAYFNVLTDLSAACTKFYTDTDTTNITTPCTVFLKTKVSV